MPNVTTDILTGVVAESAHSLGGTAIEPQWHSGHPAQKTHPA